MVRLPALVGSFVVVLSLSTLACSRQTPPAASRAPPAHRAPEFATPELRETACERLRSHVIVLFADDWARSQGVPAQTMTDDERWALYAGFTQALEEKGTLARFAESCTSSLTPRKFQCGMRSKTRDGLIWCMQTES